jgi:hypothetical protein
MYGVENIFETSTLFNNTRYVEEIRNKIPITLVLEPQTHFQSPNYTSFRSFISTDNMAETNGAVFSNTFGEISISDMGDIKYNKLNTDMFNTDQIFDVYLESLTTFNCKYNNNSSNMAFRIKINEWNIKNHSNLLDSNEIIIPNSTPSGSTTTNYHKDKKLNYITSITPDKISNIRGSISVLDGSTIFRNPEDNSNTDRVILDIILIPR